MIIKRDFQRKSVGMKVGKKVHHGCVQQNNIFNV